MSACYLISIILNTIFICLLALLFFFRNAVNDWLIQKIKGSENKNKEEREILKKLRNLLMEYQSIVCFYPLHLMVYFRGDANAVGFIEPYFKDSRDKHDQISKQLSELKPDLDNNTRDRLNSLMAEMTKLTICSFGKEFEKFVTGFQHMNINEFIATMVSMQQLCSSFISDIEKRINR